MRSVRISGGGVAARCCARLLQMHGFSTTGAEHSVGRLPAILVNQATERLLSDIFQRRDLLEGQHRIRRRMVAWGDGAQAQAFEHWACVLSEQALLNLLEIETAASGAANEWTVYCSTSESTAREDCILGSRSASVSGVTLRHGEGSDACWIESLPQGWAFLLPMHEESGILLTVGAGGTEMLSESRMISAQIESLNESSASVPASPRMRTPFCGEGWLAAGSAALAFDPLCGEGAGYAAREAILASAVIQASAEEEIKDLLAEYSIRLATGFLRHLQLCRSFYRSGGDSDWWRSELATLDKGIQAVEERVRAAQPPQFQLSGFHLKRL